jgi:hypothetical protein
VRAVVGAAKSDSLDPLIDKPGILPRAEMAGMIDAARKDIIGGCATATLKPRNEACSHISGQFELDRSPGLLLDDNRPGPHIGSCQKIADLDLHEVAASQLAVDRQVEQRPVSEARFPIQEKADSPNLFLRQWSFGADRLARIPRRPALHHRITV